MRITDNMRQDQVLRNLQASSAAMVRAQQQVSTGQRFSQPSEDPVAAASVMRSTRALTGITQYRRNITATRSRLDAEESVLDQTTDILSRAKELAISQGTDTATAATRLDAAAEVDQMIEQLTNLGNTKVGEEYIFGGNQTSAAPFQTDGTYVGDNGVRQAEVSAGYVIDTTNNGNQLLVNSGVLSSLKDLRDQLRGGSAASVAATITSIDSAFAQTQVSLAGTGSRSRQLDSVGENLDALESSLQTRQESDQGIDIAEATVRLVGIQNTLQAALLSTSQVMSMNLTQYLQ